MGNPRRNGGLPYGNPNTSSQIHRFSNPHAIHSGHLFQNIPIQLIYARDDLIRNQFQTR